MNDHCYADLLQRACTDYADLPALRVKRKGEYRTWTYADLHRDLNRLTSVLRDLGLCKGKNAAVIGENSPEWIIACHSIFLTGACAVPIDPNIPAAEIEAIMAVTRPEAVFCSPIYEGLFLSLRKKRDFPRHIVVFGDEAQQQAVPFSRFIIRGDAALDAFAGPFAPDDPMTVLFTSGTTGAPKGVVLCQKNYTPVANSAIPRMRLGPVTGCCPCCRSIMYSGSPRASPALCAAA